MYLDECGLPPTFVFYKWLAFGPYEVSVTHRGPIEGHDIHPGDWAEWLSIDSTIAQFSTPTDSPHDCSSSRS